MGDSNLKLILISSTLDCTTSQFQRNNKKFKSWQVCDWLAKWLIILGFMDLRWPRVYRRSNVGLVYISAHWPVLVSPHITIVSGIVVKLWCFYSRKYFLKVLIVMISLQRHHILMWLASQLFIEQVVKTNKWNIKVPYYWLVCEGNPPVTGGFPSQRASNAEAIPRHNIIMFVQKSIRFWWIIAMDN